VQVFAIGSRGPVGEVIAGAEGATLRPEDDDPDLGRGLGLLHRVDHLAARLSLSALSFSGRLSVMKARRSSVSYLMSS
jgi:hypothetical protein